VQSVCTLELQEAKWVEFSTQEMMFAQNLEMTKYRILSMSMFVNFICDQV
jgi:hypothetical protein